jgi:hypothetical protein
MFIKKNKGKIKGKTKNEYQILKNKKSKLKNKIKK